MPSRVTDWPLLLLKLRTTLYEMTLFEIDSCACLFRVTHHVESTKVGRQGRQTEIDRGTLNMTSTAGTYSHGHLYRPRPVAVTVGQELIFLFSLLYRLHRVSFSRHYYEQGDKRKAKKTLARVRM